MVGHSYGGAVALKVAELHPEAVHGVVVYEPPLFGWLLEDDPHSAAWREVQAVISAIDGFLERGDPASAARGFVDYWSGEGAWDRLSVPAQGAMAGRMPAIRAHFEALRGEALAALRARRRPPIVFLGGSESPESTRRVAQIARVAFAEATFEVLPGMGHMGPMTHAGAVFPRIERALYGISRPRFRISSHSASTPTLPSLVWRQVERTRRVPSRTEGE